MMPIVPVSSCSLRHIDAVVVTYIQYVSGNEAGSFQTLQTSTQHALIGDKNWQVGSVITLVFCFEYQSDLLFRYRMDKKTSVPCQLLVICVIVCAALANGNIIFKSNRYIVYMFLCINMECFIDMIWCILYVTSAFLSEQPWVFKMQFQTFIEVFTR